MRARGIVGVTCLGLLCFAYPTFANSGPPGAVRQEAASGQVLASRDGQVWAALQAPTLQPGDRVRTGPDGQTVLHFSSGDRIRLAPGSELVWQSTRSGRTELELQRGQLYGQAAGNLRVDTARSRTTASRGEFFLQTQTAGARLQVLGGNARLVSKDGDAPRYPDLGRLPPGVDGQKLLGRQNATDQMVGDFDPSEDTRLAGGPSKGKDAGPRKATSSEAVGSFHELRPDADIVAPTPPAPPVVQATPPAVASPPPTVAVAPAAAVGGGTSPFLFGGIGGLALVGVLTGVTPGGDDDNEVTVPPAENPPVPSPSRS